MLVLRAVKQKKGEKGPQGNAERRSKLLWRRGNWEVELNHHFAWGYRHQRIRGRALLAEGVKGIRNWTHVKLKAFLDLYSRELKGQVWSWRGGNQNRMLKAQGDYKKLWLTLRLMRHFYLACQLLSSCLPAPHPPLRTQLCEAELASANHISTLLGAPWRETAGRSTEKKWLLPAGFLEWGPQQHCFCTQ